MGSKKKNKKRPNTDSEDDTSNKRTCTLQTSDFNWTNLCFLCGEKECLKKNIKHSVVSEINAEKVKQKILYAAKIRGDTDLQNSLGNSIDLFQKIARYHLVCYQNYVNERALSNISRREETKTRSIPYETIAKNTVLFFKEKFEVGEIVLLPLLCEHFRNALVKSKFKTIEEAEDVKSCFIKSKLEKVTEVKLKFYSHPGKPDIVASSEFSIVFLCHKLIDSTKNFTGKSYEKNDNCINDNVALHRAAAIVRTEIDHIDRTDTFYLPQEVSMKYSMNFVPLSLRKLISWIIDEISFYRGSLPTEDKNHEGLWRRILSISECLIYCSTRKSKNSIIPPFHLGLALQLHHMFGKKSLIDLINSHGFCCSNDDIRNFLTLAAEKELEKGVDVYVRSGLINRENGGKFIQEGDDNVDINTQTIDGKNTYHAMARVIFQVQEVNEFVETERITRNSDKRSLDSHYKDSFAVLHYQKPTARPEPPTFIGCESALNSILDKKNNFCVTDLSWALLRNVTRGIFSKNTSSQALQIIPSWVPFNSHFADVKSTFTNVLYIPAINENQVT